MSYKLGEDTQPSLEESGNYTADYLILIANWRHTFVFLIVW